jgi:AI-2 transport protein TqsA
MEQKTQTACLLILTSIALAAALYWLSPVMVPFVLALFIYLGLAAAVDLQMRWLRFPRPLALLSTLVVMLMVFTLFATLVSTSVRQMTANAGAYEQKIGQLIERVATVLPVEGNFTRERVRESMSEISVGAVSTVLRQTTNAIAGILSRSLLVLILVTFLLIGEGGKRAAPDSVWSEIERRVTRYIVTKGMVSAVTGFLVGLTLSLLRVDLALVFGLFAFMLNVIPSIGSIIATLLPIPVVLVSPNMTPLIAVLAIVIPGSIQIVIGNLVEPTILGESLDLHPVTIVLALIFWGMLWGIVGALLAVPMTAIMKILLERFEPGRPVAELMAGRLPDLT